MDISEECFIFCSWNYTSDWAHQVCNDLDLFAFAGHHELHLVGEVGRQRLAFEDLYHLWTTNACMQLKSWMLGKARRSPSPSHTLEVYK